MLGRNLSLHLQGVAIIVPRATSTMLRHARVGRGKNVTAVQSKATCQPDFFGLLHIAKRAVKPINLSSDADPIDLYVHCASLCARSFEAQGYRWRLITNEPRRVEERIRALGLSSFELEPYAFGWTIPDDIPFYSAHFKLELYDAFGKGVFGPHVALVDIDTVLLRPFPQEALTANALVGYDLTAGEIRDYGLETIAGAISEIAGETLPATWWGGEFLLGRAEDFATLSYYIADIWPRYAEHWRTLHHQGDEALTSTAITRMKRDGLPVVDAGALGGVHRWWSARTLSPHPPLALALTKSLLHLPADKEFLAMQADQAGFDPAAFLSAYRRLAYRKALSRRVVDIVRRVRPSGPRKYAPRIAR